MCAFIESVAQYASVEDIYRQIPVPVEHNVGQSIEKGSKDDQKYRRYYESVTIHWQVLIDALEKEVRCDADSIVW